MIRDVASLAPTSPAPRVQPAAPEPAGPPRQEPPVLSPALRLDAALNLLVLEFRNSDGRVLHSIPTPQELDAYRSGAEDLPPAFDTTG